VFCPPPRIPRLDRDSRECFTSGECGVLIALTPQHSIAEHQQRVSAVQSGTGDQVCGELIRLLDIQSQKERHGDGPEPYPTLAVRQWHHDRIPRHACDVRCRAQCLRTLLRTVYDVDNFNGILAHAADDDEGEAAAPTLECPQRVQACLDLNVRSPSARSYMKRVDG
jgi:hypothetical protein